MKFGASVFALFGLSLAITLSLFQRLYPSPFSSYYYAVVSAVLTAAGITVALVSVGFGLRGLYSKRHRPLATIAIWALDRALSGSPELFESTGIGHREGNLVIRVTAGSDQLIRPHDRFLAYNKATRNPLGVVEASDVGRDSSLCQVFDRMDQTEFWEDLELRMTRDFSPHHSE